MEPFTEGEAVTLNDVDHVLGHIVGVSDDGASVTIRWQRRPGHDHEVTVEPTTALRRVHESEEGMI
jgi:hypothetical protein